MQTQVINGRYRVESQLGRGSQGEVLLALDQKLGRHVALKMLRVNQDFASQAGQSLRREAMIMARFHNPHVVSVYDYDTSSADGSPFLVMEYLQGETLDKLSWPLKNDELRTLVSQVGNALQHAHEIGLVHRDLKPANLMLVEREKITKRFMVLDLGIAKLTDVANPSMQSFAGITFSGAGTPFYMAPEQAKAEHVDHRADIYAMGSIIYEFMSGEPVFSGSADSMLTLLNAIISTEPVPIEQVSSRPCSKELNALIMQCLEKSPDLRPASMSEVVKRFLDHFSPNLADTQPASPTNVATPSVESAQTNTFTGRTIVSQPGDTARRGGKTEPPPVPTAVDHVGATGTSRGTSDDTQKPQPIRTHEHVESARGLPRSWLIGLAILGVLAIAIPAAVIALKLGDQSKTAEVDETESTGTGEGTARSTESTGHSGSGQTSTDDPNREAGTTTTPTKTDLQLGEFQLPEGEPWSYVVKPDEQEFTSFAFDGQPPNGLELDRATGELTWRPSEDQGTHQFPVVVVATQADGSSVHASLELEVIETNLAPQVETIDPITADELQEIDFTVQAKDMDRPANSLRYELGPMAPKTARIDPSTGRFTWTPSEADGPGQFEFSVSVNDGETSSVTPVSVSVNEVNRSPKVTAVDPITQDETEKIEFTIDAVDSDLPANRLEYVMSAAPDGASFDETTGKFSWTPTERQGPGEFDVDFQVSDGMETVDLTVEITVKEVARSPVVAKIPAQAVRLDQNFQMQVEATDPDFPISPLRYSLANEPEGMTIDPETGAIRWQPDLANVGKEIAVDVEIEKSPRLISKKTFLLNVEPGTLITNSIGMELRYIPAGQFVMGSPEEESQRSEDELLHGVQLSKPFLMGIHEVTQEQYEIVMGITPSHFRAGGEGAEEVEGLETQSFPVDSVSYADAVEFCSRLNELERDSGRTYRLPTEAEWEYACRAGTDTPFSFAATANGTRANLNGASPYGTAVKGPNLARTTTVGSYAPNPLGLYDMHGNVSEWCLDRYAETTYRDSSDLDPSGPDSGSYRVLRGGSWRNPAHRCRSARRNFGLPSDRTFYSGFRVVCEVASDE